MSRIRALISLAFSIVLLAVSLALVAGSAYAWFTVSTSNTGNVIQAKDTFPSSPTSSSSSSSATSGGSDAAPDADTSQTQSDATGVAAREGRAVTAGS